MNNNNNNSSSECINKWHLKTGYGPEASAAARDKPGKATAIIQLQQQQQQQHIVACELHR